MGDGEVSELSIDELRRASEQLVSVLSALPPAGSRDAGLRSAVEQRAQALMDVAEYDTRDMER